MKKSELIKNSGREIAVLWMERALKDAESEEQLTNQVEALRAAAISVLAHEGYNRLRQFKTV